MNKNINNKKFLTELVEVTNHSPIKKSTAPGLMPKAHGLNNNFYMLHSMTNQAKVKKTNEDIDYQSKYQNVMNILL